MAAKIVTVSPNLIWEPEELQRLWFFPDGSEYLQYAPHFHAIYPNGFRTNLPLNHMFVIVMEGKFSIKDYYGQTVRIRVETWHAPCVLSSMLREVRPVSGKACLRAEKREQS